MKLTSIEATNFKIFDSLHLELNGRNTVIFGVNGTGKSSILAIINYLFRIWVNRLNPLQGRAYESITKDLVRIGSSSMYLSCEVEMDNRIFSLSRSYVKISPKGSSLYDPKKYKAFTQYFEETYLREDANMPLFVNYGTNRSVLQIPLRIRTKHDFSQVSALERAIENELDFRTFFEWYRNQEDMENEHIRETGELDYQDVSLKCVRRAVESMLGNVSDLKVKRNPLCMKVKKGNVDLRVDFLSDGEKCTLALFGDLARRLAIANPHLENPLEGEGIVLIDEIELHMHPLWQRRVLNELRKVFPNIQFIVTTHSPQVLGEVDKSFFVVKLNYFEDNSCIVEPISSRLDGYDSNLILEDYMETASKNPIVKDMIDDAYRTIASGEYEKALEMIESIKEFTNGDSEDTISLEGFMRRRQLQDAKNS